MDTKKKMSTMHMNKIDSNNIVSSKLLILSLTAIVTFMPAYAFADSSWIWLTDYRPFDILPPVGAATIVIEILAIWLIPRTGAFAKTAIVVTLANAASFLLPYLMLKIGMNWYGSFDHILDAGPNYIVGAAFLIITLCVETPLVYKSLESNVKNTKVLLITILVVNAVTTAGVAVVERMITDGYWV